MILDKMYNLLIDDIRQKINDDLAKTLDERDSQYYNFFKKIEVMNQRFNELNEKVNNLSRFGKGNMNQFILDNQKMINGFSEGLNNVYQEYQQFKEDVYKEFDAIKLKPPRIGSEIPIATLDLNTRLRNSLLDEGLDTIEKVLKYHNENWKRHGLLKLQNMGKKSYKILKSELEKHGYPIKDC